MQLNNPLSLLALIGMIAFTVTSYFNYIIYKRLKHNGETTIEYLVLRGEIKKAFELLIGSTLVFLVSSLITVASIELDLLVLSQSIRVGTAILFISYTVFFAVLAVYTRPEKLKNFK